MQPIAERIIKNSTPKSKHINGLIDTTGMGTPPIVWKIMTISIETPMSSDRYFDNKSIAISLIQYSVVRPWFYALSKDFLS